MYSIGGLTGEEDSRVCEEVVETNVREEGGGEKDGVKKPAIQQAIGRDFCLIRIRYIAPKFLLTITPILMCSKQ